MEFLFQRVSIEHTQEHNVNLLQILTLMTQFLLIHYAYMSKQKLICLMKSVRSLPTSNSTCKTSFTFCWLTWRRNTVCLLAESFYWTRPRIQCKCFQHTYINETIFINTSCLFIKLRVICLMKSVLLPPSPTTCKTKFSFRRLIWRWNTVCLLVESFY